MKLGDTFINLNPGSPDHLWFVVSSPAPDGSIAIVNLTSMVDGCDDTCILRRGDHPFITRDSVIAYQHGRILIRTAQDALTSKGYSELREPATADVLKRIQHGALASLFTPKKVMRAIEASLALPQ